ncbi:Hypothetical_protein [Hexamita inflata]|uniref:Hypothetical_protein n=1 Tax=Hexamita inflata TaxID=28002 RepID=A0ABP1IYW6_9EUKA
MINLGQHAYDRAEIDQLIKWYAEQLSKSAVPTLNAAKAKVLLTNINDNKEIQAVNLKMSKLLGICYKTVQQDFSRKVLPCCQFMLPEAITNWIKKYCIDKQAIKYIKDELKKIFNVELFNFTYIDSLLRNSIKRKANPICLKEFDEFISCYSTDTMKQLKINYLNGTTPHEEIQQAIDNLSHYRYTHQSNQFTLIVFGSYEFKNFQSTTESNISNDSKQAKTLYQSGSLNQISTDQTFSKFLNISE